MRTVQIAELLTLQNLVHATCGGLGSAISISLVYPLETARTRLQVDVDSSIKRRSSVPLVQDIVRQEGLPSLYRGWSSLVFALFLTNFVYFYVFHGLRALLLSGGSLVATDLGCATVAGVITVLLTNPFWVINTRLKLQGVPGAPSRELKKLKRPRYRGIVHCLTTIVHDEGLGALWSGTSSSLVLVCNPVLQFVTYEALKRGEILLWAPDALRHLINGTVAKLVATLCTYPLQVAQTRRRAGLIRSRGMVRQLSGIVEASGVAGLFQGLESKIIQTCLTAALMFLVYEKLSSVVFALAGLEK